MKHMTKEMLDYTYPKSQKIFEPGFEYHTVNKISDMFEENGELCLETGMVTFQKATLRISMVNDYALRIRYSQKFLPQDTFKDHITNETEYTLPKYKVLENAITISLKNKKVVITKNPFNIETINADGKVEFSMNEDKNDGFEMFGQSAAPKLGFKAVDDDILLPYFSFKIHNDENIYGLGEKFGALEKTGTRSSIFNTDTSGKNMANLGYARIPFILSSRNWGILFDTGVKTHFEIGSDVMDAGSIMPEQQYLDMYFFVGNSIKEISSDYTRLTGRIDGINDRTYGIWLSRLYYYDREDLREQLEQGAKAKTPIDAFHIDPKWIKNRYTKSCNFVEADERWGDFEDFYKEMTKADIGISLWVNPYVQGDDSEFFRVAKEKGYLLKSTNGGYAHAYTNVELYQTDLYIMDFSNPEAFNYWVAALEEQVRKGAYFAVNDYGDGVPADALFHNGKTGEEMRGYFMYLYNKASHTAFENVHGKGFAANISRPGYIGSHKFPGKWGGDSDSRWEDLKASIQGGLSISMNGEVMWGTDIGGFLDRPTDELYIRWTQYGTFTPYTRLHGITPREPWMFSEAAVKNAQKFFKLKRQWIPHYKVGEMEAVETGITTMRPLVMEFQNDKIVRKIDDQYMLNSNVMVAPVIDEGATSRQVYMPEGIWVNYFNGKTYEGRRSYNLDVNLNELLVFVKKGSALVTFKNGSYKMSNIGNQTLVINLYAGEISKGVHKFKIDGKDIEVKWSTTKTSGKATIKGHEKFEVVVK